jgi:hypothetical protein
MVTMSSNTDAGTAFHYNEGDDGTLHTHLNHEITLADKPRPFLLCYLRSRHRRQAQTARACIWSRGAPLQYGILPCPPTASYVRRGHYRWRRIVDCPDAVDGLRTYVARRLIEPRTQRLLPGVTPGRGSACAVLRRAARLGQ